MINYLALIISIAVAAVAAWYSIIGLMAIFAAAAIPIAIMGVVLEAAKLVTASWLFNNWKIIPAALKVYLTGAVVTLMFITSMGIFGYLSKAHIDQGQNAGDSIAKIERIEQRIAVETSAVDRAKTQMAALDAALEKYVELGSVTKSLQARESQKEERELINKVINEGYEKIDALNSEIAELKSVVRSFELEVGPIKYVAELLYDDANLESAVRAVIIVLIFVFDPLAVLLLIAANMGIKQDIRNRKRGRPASKNNTPEWLEQTREFVNKKKKGIIEIDKDSVMRMK